LGSHNYGGKENDFTNVIGNISSLSITCMHIMDKAYEIMGIEDAEGIKMFMGQHFEKSTATKVMSATRKDYDNGDIVLTC